VRKHDDELTDIGVLVDGRWKNAVNFMNPLGTKGNIARSFAMLLHDMWHGDLPYITPMGFRVRFECFPSNGISISLFAEYDLLTRGAIQGFRPT